MSGQIQNDTSPPNAWKGRLARRGIPSVLLLLVVAGLYAFWRNSDAAPVPEAPPPGPIPVSVVTVRTETAPVRMRFLGQTEGAQTVEIRARVAGYLQPRLFKEGARVEKGQKLFQIDPRPFEVELTQAKAVLDSAEAKREQARLNFNRLDESYSKGVGSKQEFDTAQAQLRVAVADVAQQKARIAASELQLGYASIESPITSVIGRAQKDTGSYIDAGQNGLLAVVQQVDPMYVRYSVTEKEILRFQGQVAAKQIAVPKIDEVELEVTLSDGSTYPHRGRINFIDVQVDLTTGTSVVRGQVPNPDGKLQPGQFIYASVLGVQRIGVVRVPQKAVTQSPVGASVFVVNDQSAIEARPVVLGEWSGAEHWIVERGLKPGDRVVTDRLMVVRPGTSVTATEHPPQTGAGAPPVAAQEKSRP